MSLAVGSVLFDHGRGVPGSYTVPLRYNEAVPVLLPEWQGQALPSVAAYRLDRLPRVAEVEVTLFASPDEPRVQEIRAIAQPFPGALLPTPLLPGLEPRLVAFDGGGASLPLRFRFPTDAMRVGVAVETLSLNWQTRTSEADPWRDFARTPHRIYVLLSAPSAPWFVAPSVPANMALPRTDMLDFACAWAFGATSTDAAASGITAAVNGLGGSTFLYDEIVGAPHYTLLGLPLLLCDALVDRLRGGPGLGPLVNCSDCATIVSTMANLVGADLWQSKMGLIGDGFPLNPILGIGRREFSRLYGGFTFHEVAWAGDCGADDVVYDACVKVDGDRNPARAPHRPVLSAGSRFVEPDGSGLRDRIAAPRGVDLCTPQPALRIRRAISRQTAVPFFRTSAVLRGALVERFAAGPAERQPAEHLHFEGVDLLGTELPGWSMQGRVVADSAAPDTSFAAALLRARGAGPALAVRTLASFWRSRGRSGGRLRLETIETQSAADARELALAILGEIEHPELRLWDRKIAGELAVRRRDGSFVLLTRGNLVNVAFSVGSAVVAVGDDMASLDDWLATAGSPADAGSPVPSGWSRRVVPTAAARTSGAAPAVGVRYIVTPADAARRA